MDRKEKAIQLHDLGYNCAQAVLLAFDDKLDVDSKLLFKISGQLNELDHFLGSYALGF